MITAIIFDCFGVIRPDRLTMLYQLFGGDPVADRQFIHDTVLAANRGMIVSSRSVFAKRLGITEADWIGAFDGEDTNDQQVLDCALLLREHYKTALLSNVSRGRLPELFQPGELEKYFDVAIGSGDIGYAKPEARAYEITADRLGVCLDECVMIDDREEYCAGARAAGMQAIRYESMAQLQAALQPLLAATSR